MTQIARLAYAGRARKRRVLRLWTRLWLSHARASPCAHPDPNPDSGPRPCLIRVRDEVLEEILALQLVMIWRVLVRVVREGRAVRRLGLRVGHRHRVDVYVRVGMRVLGARSEGEVEVGHVDLVDGGAVPVRVGV